MEQQTVHLKFKQDCLCGVHSSSRSWVWPFYDTQLTWPEACPDCVRVYRTGTVQQPKAN